MEIQIFGKPNCNLCEAAKKKVAFFLEKWGLTGQVPMTFVDMTTVDGRAEGAFRDVIHVPTTVVVDGEEELGRWETTAPDSDTLRRALGLAQ